MSDRSFEKKVTFNPVGQAWIVSRPGTSDASVVVNGTYEDAVRFRSAAYEDACKKESGGCWVVELNDWEIEAALAVVPYAQVVEVTPV